MALVASLPGQGQAGQWAATQSSGTAGPVQLATVAFDGASNTVVGSFEGTVTLGSFTLTRAGGTDGVVARLSPVGVWLQAVRQQMLPTHAAKIVLGLAGLPPGLYLMRAGTATSKLTVE